MFPQIPFGRGIVQGSFRVLGQNRPGIRDLFKLDPTDYKGWAHGLQKAGYATNPQYAQQLIKIIEDYQLFLLDEGQDVRIAENAAPSKSPSQNRFRRRRPQIW